MIDGVDDEDTVRLSVEYGAQAKNSPLLPPGHAFDAFQPDDCVTSSTIDGGIELFHDSDSP